MEEDKDQTLLMIKVFERLELKIKEFFSSDRALLYP